MACQGLVNESIAWKWPHLWLMHARWCHSCVFDGALLGQFPPVRQGAPVLRRGQSSAVWLFLFPQLVCALSTSALRAERGPRTRLRISISIGARPAPAYTEKFSSRTVRSTGDRDKGEHRKVRVSKKRGKDQVHEGSELPSRFINRG